VTLAQLADGLAKLQDHPLEAIVALDLATSMRQGELLALRLALVDLDKGTPAHRALARANPSRVVALQDAKTAHWAGGTISLRATTVAVSTDTTPQVALGP
jgi:integrase